MMSPWFLLLAVTTRMYTILAKKKSSLRCTHLILEQEAAFKGPGPGEHDTIYEINTAAPQFLLMSDKGKHLPRSL